MQVPKGYIGICIFFCVFEQLLEEGTYEWIRKNFELLRA